MRHDGAHRIFLTITTLLIVMAAVPTLAAELLDVKPVANGADVVIEVTADIPMTYSYYKLPGEARAVVDIADADPEKVEPLIVVNKGAIASISVDKAQIAGLVVSRLVFNLVKQSDIRVTAAADRKMLVVSFGGTGAPAPPAPAAAPAPEQKKEAAPPAEPPTPETPAKVTPPSPATPAAAPPKEDDPLGLDEPPAAPGKAATPTAPAPAPDTPAVTTPPASTSRLAPVVPAESAPVAIRPVVIGVSAGDGYIDIKTKGPVGTFKPLRLTKPERLVIDLPEAKSAMKAKSVTINKNGVTQVRVGSYPGYVRIVFDTSKESFPAHDIASKDDGLRISLR